MNSSGLPARTRVKICGITRPEDACAAARFGADAIGLVFYPRSPRAVSPAQARDIIQSLPAFVTTVGLFVDAPQAELQAVLDAVPLDLLQFHGSEPAADCRRYGRPYIKALAMRDDRDMAAEAAQYDDAAGILLDAFHADMHGGTGEVFDWDRIPMNLPQPLILAGGLAPDNIAEAITRVQPYAVDVSSGVEQAKGIKDADRMSAFIRGVYSVDNSR